MKDGLLKPNKIRNTIPSCKSVRTQEFNLPYLLVQVEVLEHVERDVRQAAAGTNSDGRCYHRHLRKLKSNWDRFFYKSRHNNTQYYQESVKDYQTIKPSYYLVGLDHYEELFWLAKITFGP